MEAPYDAVVFLRLGGKYTHSVLVGGEISTLGLSQRAVDLYKSLSRCLTRGFTKTHWCGTYKPRLGREALALARRGVRLTHDARYRHADFRP
jgi:hypothetical protein